MPLAPPGKDTVCNPWAHFAAQPPWVCPWRKVVCLQRPFGMPDLASFAFSFWGPCCLLTLLLLPLGFQNKKVHDAVTAMAAESLRCVAVAYRDVTPAELALAETGARGGVPEDHLCLLAILGIKVRPTLPSSLTHLPSPSLSSPPFSLPSPSHAASSGLSPSPAPPLSECHSVTMCCSWGFLLRDSLTE